MIFRWKEITCRKYLFFSISAYDNPFNMYARSIYMVSGTHVYIGMILGSYYIRYHLIDKWMILFSFICRIQFIKKKGEKFCNSTLLSSFFIKKKKFKFYFQVLLFIHLFLYINFIHNKFEFLALLNGIFCFIN